MSWIRQHPRGVFEEFVCAPDAAQIKAPAHAQAFDFDRDGDLDIVVTNYQLENNTLYLNNFPFFDEVSFNSGIGEVSLNYLGFGVGFFDWDNDGWLDIFAIGDGVQAFRNQGTAGFTDTTAALGLDSLTGQVHQLAAADIDDAITAPKYYKGTPWRITGALEELVHLPYCQRAARPVFEAFVALMRPKDASISAHPATKVIIQ